MGKGVSTAHELGKLVRGGRLYVTYHSAATAIASALLGSMSGLRPGVFSVRPSSSTSNMPCRTRRPHHSADSVVCAPVA
jgi:hypothetical protein